MSYTNIDTDETIPSISTLHMSIEQLSKLRRYEGYWLLVRKHKFIQIVLPRVEHSELKLLRKRYIQAIKKEKHRDVENKHIGELSFSYFNNLLLVRIL